MKIPKLQLSPLPELWEQNADSKASAVLALFIPSADGEAHLLFTRRSADLRSHAGQVGFPGGRREAGDLSPLSTALRESFEEISLPSSDVHFLGVLPTIKALDGRPVLPVVAYSHIAIDSLKANPEEVSEIFAVHWRELTEEKCSQLRFNIFGHWRETPYFEASGHQIWGLTAWMVKSMKLGNV